MLLDEPTASLDAHSSLMGAIIVKKLVMMSSGIAHTAFGGIGLGHFLGIDPIIRAIFFSISSSLGITAPKRNSIVNSDVLIGMLWPLGMALGNLFCLVGILGLHMFCRSLLVPLV